MSDSEKHNLQEMLQTIIETVDLTSVMTEPLTESVKNLLRLSARSMNSDEASVIIRDGDNGDLIFLSAIGQVADQLIGMRIPSGKGIAGFVFSSGQPMAVADVGQEQTFYAEVDKKTGYSTQTILATPLRFNDEVIGVLEYVNRIGEPPFAPFTSLEMDKAALFAEAVSALVNAYESANILQEIVKQMLEKDDTADLSEVRTWLDGIHSTAEHREMIDLALLVREISCRSPKDRTLCREILETILRHSNSGNETSFLSF